jgi:hypothetical protein
MPTGEVGDDARVREGTRGPDVAEQVRMLEQVDLRLTQPTLASTTALQLTIQEGR